MSDNQIDFTDRVVVVTGGGNGLGKCYAMEFAKRGAKVVVNDLGGTGTGAGADQIVAQKVVSEIQAMGGTAVANSDSVLEGDKVVQTALDAFGRVDAVVNNAGFLRDGSFHKMTEADWDLVLKVHLYGSFAVTRAAWPYMRDQGFGRVVMTASGAGIYGNFGQANYAAAKLGLHGLAQTLAHEGRAKGILVNTIAPVAASRLTSTVMPPEVLEGLKPEYVSPLVLLLCSENHTETGQLFEVGGGWIARIRWQQSNGARFDSDEGFSAEELSARWDEVQNFDSAQTPSDISSTLQAVGENIGVKIGVAPQ
ncbi:SDR family oxidoreductase [Hyphomonas sp.]|uniref:SDR family oxidoreductase n=1 Tax=Hyphomonas sp. TaxID=87 RepID=UPI003918F7E8